MGSRVVVPDVDVLKISGGDTLTVKRRLNAGEQRAMFARMYLAGVDGQMRANPLEIGLSTILAYLLDWTLTSPDGRVIPIADKPSAIVEKALNSLDPDSFGEIQMAILQHEEAMQADRETEKNVQGGENKSSAILPSPVAVAGATSGLLN